MKRSLIALVPVALLLLGLKLAPSNNAAKVVVEPVKYADDDLKPTMTQEKVQANVAKFFANYHFRKFKLNDSLSSMMYDNYLKEIDAAKLYFLEADIKSFEKYRNQLDEFLDNGRLDAAYDIYNTFRRRYRERTAYLETLFKVKKFDFTADESFVNDREKTAWAKDSKELDEVWRKLIKSEALDLKLRNNSDSAIVAKLKERYQGRERGLGRIRSDQVFQMYMNSFCEVLDPHTRYFSPQDSDRFKQEMYKSLEGIGALLREEGNYIKIAEIIPGGPAAKDKRLKANDKIVAVGQGDSGPMENIEGWYVDDAVKKIKGAKGTTVRLQVIPAGGSPSDPLKEVKLVREKVNLQEARASKQILSINYNKQDYKFGIITIPSFYRDFEEANRRNSNFNSTTRDVAKILDTLKTAGVDGVVLDLRNNGGGSLTEAISLTGLFIQKGPVVQVRESKANSADVYTDQDPALQYDGPLAVMTNRFSASASEIFAAAIQDYKRGVIIGEQTYGKGTVQTMVDLNQLLSEEKEKLGQVNITVQKFYRINGSSTQIKGVTPDVSFPSAFNQDEYREISEGTPLPWDQIVTARYEITKYLNDKQLSKLKDKSQQRQKSDTNFKTFTEELEYSRKLRENKVISLQETKRKKQRDEEDKHRKILEKLTELEPEDDEDNVVTTNAGKKKKPDMFLQETERILADYIILNKTANLANK